MRATREDSGWKIAEPRPTSAAAKISSAYVCARDNTTRPTIVKPIETGSENGIGRLSLK